MNNNPENLVRYYEYLMEHANKITSLLKEYPFDEESYIKTEICINNLALSIDKLFTSMDGITDGIFDIDKQKLRDLKIKQIIE